jgi:hypothetical protein
MSRGGHVVDIHITVTGPVTVNQFDVSAFTAPILARLDALEATMSAPLTTIDEALTALQAEVATLTADEAADRAAFDALAAVVRAFIASVSSTPGALTPEQATQAQAILDSIGAADAGETAQAADEAALEGEVPQA